MKKLNPDAPHYKSFCKISESLRGRIVELRHERGLHQEDMISHGISVRQYQRIESGDTKNISLSTLHCISQALDISLSDLLREL